MGMAISSTTAPTAPPSTRARLLAAGYDEIYERGFQAASIDRILSATSLTRGAFFHYFPTKLEFGYAVLDEVIAGMIRAQWVTRLARSRNPVRAIPASLETGIKMMESAGPIFGCPLNNLAQEMSALDAGFQQRASVLFGEWSAAVSKALDGGIERGYIDPAVDTAEAGLFVVALVEGCISLAKNAQDVGPLRVGLRQLKLYLSSLQARAPG